MKPTGRYTKLSNTDPAFAERWATELGKRAEEETFQAALANIDDYDAAVDAVKGVIGADNYASVRAASGRMEAFASEAEAIDNWSRVVVDDALAHTHGSDGTRLDAVIDAARKQEPIPVELLEEIPELSRPLHVSAPETLAVPRSWWNQVVDKGFEKIIDPQVNYISRQPIFVHEYVLARRRLAKDVRRLERAGVSGADELGQEWAVHAAEHAAIRQVDDLTLRNQFQQMHPTILPFWHAQEQFLKRWGRMLAHNPTAFRKAQLGMMGLRHSGLVTQDENGDDVFAYPGWGFVQSVLAGAAKPIFGDMKLPVSVPFTGKIKYLAPGLDRSLIPGVGPFVGVPLKAARQLWPEYEPLKKVEEAAIGPGAERSLWEQFVPTVVRNAYGAVAGEPDHDQQMTSAMLNVMQLLEREGHGLKEDATEQEKTIYIDRVRKWARSMLGLRAIAGFVLPTSSPQLQYLDTLSPELRELMGALPIDQATAEFMRRHPDADAFTVFQTEAIKGGPKPLPASQEAGRWLDEHKAFVDAHGATASWFIPDGPAEFDRAVWQEEFAMGLRRRKTVDEFWTDVKVSADSDMYYRNQDRFRVELAKAQTPDLREALRDSWRQWKEGYLATRPLFSRHLRQGSERQLDREEILGRLELALADDNAPRSGHEEALGQMIRGYRSWQRSLLSLQGFDDSFSSEQRKTLTKSFAAWASTNEDTMARRLYDQVLKWQIPGDVLAEIEVAA
jgi:hypothetical protein